MYRQRERALCVCFKSPIASARIDLVKVHVYLYASVIKVHVYLCTGVIDELPVAGAATRHRHGGELHVDESPLVVDRHRHPAVDERVHLAHHVKVTLGAYLALDLTCL